MKFKVRIQMFLSGLKGVRGKNILETEGLVTINK